VVAVKRPIALAILAATTLLASVAVTGLAQAKVPGPNGQLLFGRFDPAQGDTFIYTINPDGSHEQQLLPITLECPHWSPDGSMIATCGSPSGGSALIIDPDTGEYRDLPRPDPTLPTFCFVWSPDAKRLACEGAGDIDPSRAGIYTVLASNGGDLTRVTSNPGGHDYPSDYSPNGKQIVFARTKPTGPPGANQALFVVNIDGTGLRRISPWGLVGEGGSWSPDGKAILFAFAASANAETASLFVVRPDGTGLAKIPLKTDSWKYVYNPVWSPDGTKIVFLLNTSFLGSDDVYTVNPDGSDLQKVTNDSSFENWLDWGPHPLAT
jgi:TolB protein